MARRWGSCDYRQLQKLRDNMAKLEETDMDRFCREVSRELAARLLALVIPRTPVGYYKGGTYTCIDGRTHQSSKVAGKNGGTLRRGWTANTGAAAGYAAALPVEKAGNEYRIEVINPVQYASYVEFGHRTANGRGWVKGHYFLTLSEQDLRALAPALIEKKLAALLREVFRV